MSNEHMITSYANAKLKQTFILYRKLHGDIFFSHGQCNGHKHDM